MAETYAASLDATQICKAQFHQVPFSEQEGAVRVQPVRRDLQSAFVCG